MKRAKRPDIYNQAAIIEKLVARGLAQSLAEPLTGDMKLIIPLLIREVGVDRINDILQRCTSELHLREQAFWPSLTPYLVQWADDELEAYKARKAE